jgi:hypothetical protein
MTSVPEGLFKWKPTYLSDEDDVLHEIPADWKPRSWAENYLSHAYSPGNGIGVYFHQGSASFDPLLWNDIFVCWLPGDRFLVSKGFARLGSRTGPSGPGLTYRCDEPFRKWTKTFDGAARLVPGAVLRAGALADGLHVPVCMRLDFTATSPAFDIGDIGEQNWASSHYQQHCRVTGNLGYGDDEVVFDGTGIRDHSWGPRDTSGLARYEWSTAQFADGRNLVVFCAGNRDGTGDHAFGVLGHGGELEVVEVVERAPHLMAEGGVLEPYRLRFNTSVGAVTVDAEPLSSAPLSLAGKGELVLGHDLDGAGESHNLIVEAHTRYVWDGVVGFGHTERARPV